MKSYRVAKDALPRRRSRGRVQFESLVLVGAIALGGVAGFQRIGTSSQLAISEQASTEVYAASAPVEMGGGQQAAVISVFENVAEIGRRAQVVGEANYSSVPLKLRKTTTITEPSSVFKKALTVFRRSGDNSVNDTLEALSDFGAARAKLIVAALQDVRQALGEDAFQRAPVGVSYSKASPETNALYATYFPSRSDNATANLKRARSVLPDDVYARLEALVEIYNGGISEARRDELFPQSRNSAKSQFSDPVLQATMMNTLGRLDESVSSAALSRLEGDSIDKLFASLQRTGLSDKAIGLLTDSFKDRFNSAQRLLPSNGQPRDRKEVAQQLVRKVLPLVLAGDPDAALRRLRAIDEEYTLARNLDAAKRQTLLSELEAAIVTAADRFDRPGLDVTDRLSLAPVNDDTVLRTLPGESDAPDELFEIVKAGQAQGLPEAYAKFLSSIVTAFPGPAPGLSGIDVAKLVYLAAQRAPVGRLDETRGFGTLIREASDDTDLGNAVARQLERYAERFAAGREQNRMPDGRQTAQADGIDDAVDSLLDRDNVATTFGP